MADYAGAVAAIRARLEENWTATRVTYQNEVPDDPWPPKQGMKHLPWVNLEVAGLPSALRGAGVPGQQLWRYPGFIYVHVFAPTSGGMAPAIQKAVAIGEIFRGKVFYQDAPGCYVRTWSPFVDGGGSGADDGNWYRCTMTVPFEYWHRG